jgi:hypothetical protein
LQSAGIHRPVLKKATAGFPDAGRQSEQAICESFSEYKKVSEGSTKAGVYDGYEFRFERLAKY